jgi:hypothetical protein
MDERTLTARLKSWIDQELSSGAYSPLDGADNEIHVAGGRERHDVVIYKDGASWHNIECKVPTSPEGGSPYVGSVVKDAHDKAVAEGHAYFGTFNCSSYVQWRSDMTGVPLLQRSVGKRIPAVSIGNLSALDGPAATAELRAFVRTLLTLLAELARGGPPPARSAEEEQIVEMLEDRLDVIVGLTLSAVDTAFDADHTFRTALRAWMRDDQGWQWDDDQRQELLLRATKVSCYVLMNQILFYAAMRRVFPELPPLEVGAAASGEGVRLRLCDRFADARRTTRDYETVFDTGLLTEVACKADGTVASWAGLIEGLQDVNLAAYSTDLLGAIFERLLSPEERHRFGQHYTSPELADLLLAATVRTPATTLLDPASGGGTFLVRAYERLRYLGEHDHLVLLTRIYGNDISRFAAHLSTVNLAVRSLAREGNYPRVGNHDFLRLRPGDPLLSLPAADGERPIPVPQQLDVVIGNPPYVRRQALSPSQFRSATESLMRDAIRPGLDGLSDLHAYFWTHALPFLGPEGRMALLTSASWLETTSGRSLRAHLLDNHRVRMVLKSTAEPWFVGVRVDCIATLVEREPDPARRAANSVAFGVVRAPLAHLLGSRDPATRWPAADALVAALLGGGQHDDVTIVRVPQSQLDASASWAVYLRAPLVWDAFSRLPGVVPLDTVYDAGVVPKLGSRWFVVREVEPSPAELAEHRLRPSDVGGTASPLTFVEGLQGWRGPLERRYVARAARSPKDHPRRLLGKDEGDLVIMVPPGDRLLRAPRLRAYVAFGETNGVHRRVYTGSRSTWYAVEDRPRAPIIMPSAAQFAWKVWENPSSRFLTMSPNGYLTPRGDRLLEACLAVLNSTWTFLAATLACGQVGVEGMMRFGGRTQYLRLLVVDPGRATREQGEQLTRLWRDMRKLPVHDFPPAGSEPLGGWRRELDELVAVIAGATPDDAGEMVDQLHAWVTGHVGSREHLEGQAVAGRRGRSQGSGGRPRRLADQAVAAAQPLWPWTAEDVDAGWFLVHLPQTATVVPQVELFGPGERAPGPCDLQVGEGWLTFATEAEAAMVSLLLNADLVPSLAIFPGGLAAAAWLPRVKAWIAELTTSVRSHVDERIPPDDPSNADAQLMAWSTAISGLRDAEFEMAKAAARQLLVLRHVGEPSS